MEPSEIHLERIISFLGDFRLTNVSEQDNACLMEAIVHQLLKRYKKMLSVKGDLNKIVVLNKLYLTNSSSIV